MIPACSNYHIWVNANSVAANTVSSLLLQPEVFVSVFCPGSSSGIWSGCRWCSSGIISSSEPSTQCCSTWQTEIQRLVASHINTRHTSVTGCSGWVVEIFLFIWAICAGVFLQWAVTPMLLPSRSSVACSALPGTASSWTDTRGNLGRRVKRIFSPLILSPCLHSPVNSCWRLG